jgi:hypothetical protein
MFLINTYMPTQKRGRLKNWPIVKDKAVHRWVSFKKSRKNRDIASVVQKKP